MYVTLEHAVLVVAVTTDVKPVPSPSLQPSRFYETGLECHLASLTRRSYCLSSIILYAQSTVTVNPRHALLA